MAEKQLRKETKVREAGAKGKTEVPVSRGRRLDAATPSRAIEVETSGSSTRLAHAAQKLKASKTRQHILVVPRRDMDKAEDAMRKVGISGTVKSLTGRVSKDVPRSQSRPQRRGSRTAPRRRA